MRAYLGSLSDEDAQGAFCDVILWQVIVHVVHHGMQHRSEAALLLTHFGHSPGDIDMVFWLDDRGFVIEDGVILHTSKDEYLLTCAEPNLAYFQGRIGRLQVTIEEVSHDIGTLALQGPRSRALLARLVPQMEHIPYFGVAKGEIGGAGVTVSRTGYSGDLGYEIWIDTPDALHVWDTLWDSMDGHGVLPFGLAALYMLRIEAGLLLLDADFDSSRYAWNDAHRSTPIELGWSWMFKDLKTDDRAFIGRKALQREIADKTSRWAMRGLIVDWRDYDRVYGDAGLIPPKDHAPIVEDWMLYDDEYQRVGYATSLMYSPMLQRHIALARVPLDRTAPGSHVRLELPVAHRYEYFDAVVSRLPLYNPDRRTA